LKSNWSSPFAPWVVESWRKFSEENSLPERAKRVRDNLRYGAEVSSNPYLTTKEKIDLIRKGPPKDA
jgi:hypothetical protein